MFTTAKIQRKNEKWKKQRGHFFHFTKKLLFLMRYLNYKVLYLNNRNIRPRSGLQDLKMLIVGYYEFCTCCNSTINKLIVVWISLKQSEMIVSLLVICCVQSCYCLNNIARNILVRLNGYNFFVFIHNFSIDAQLNTSIKYVCPYLMVWTFRRE